MKKVLILALFSAFGFTMFGQYANEALRISTINQGGTSRSNAMGGTFGAIEGDASSMYFNPAAMGIYQKTEITVTPGFEFSNTNAKFLGKTGRDFDMGMNINNMAIVFTYNKGQPNESTNNINIGFGYTKLNNFNENIVISGDNSINSYTDHFANKANGIYAGNFETGNNEQDKSKYQDLYFAWWNYLINPINDSTQYESTFKGHIKNQELIIDRSGYTGEYTFAVSGSIGRKLFLGANIGIQKIIFTENKYLTEFDKNDEVFAVSKFYANNFLSYNGTGVNLKIGALYRPLEWFTFGAAIHTPTFYSISERYSTYMSADIDNAYRPDNAQEYNSGEGRFNYKLNTPLRANVNTCFVINKLVLLNADYEFVHYGQARLSGTLDSDNKEIRTYLGPSHNVRIGAEVFPLEVLGFRLGATYSSSPYKKSVISNTYSMSFSGGIGLKLGKSFSLDFAYTYFMLGNESYYLYYSSPESIIATTRNRITCTLGFKF